MTLSEVANLAGVSPSTVSRVINRDSRISASTVARVRNVMNEIGYAPKSSNSNSAQQQGLARGIRTGNIALLTSGNYVYNATTIFQIEQGAASVLAQQGMNLVVARLDGSKMLPPSISKNHLDGLILATGELTRQMEAKLSIYPNIWIVSRHTSRSDYVIGGHDTCGRMAAKYLLDRGHSKLAFLTPWPVSPSQHARGDGFGFAAYQNEAKVEMIVPSPGEPQIVTDSDISDINHVEKCIGLLVDRYLALSPRPTGLFVPLDFFTAMVYRQLDKRGIKPGRDLTIISANGELCYLMGLNPRPATIDIGGETIGRRAVEQLLLRIRNPKEARGFRMIVEPVIIEGDGAE